MADFLVDRRDLDFVLYEQFDLEQIIQEIKLYEDWEREVFEVTMDTAINLASGQIAPGRDKADEEGCRLESGQVKVPEFYKESYKQFAEGGWIAPARTPELGGMGLPLPLAMALSEVFIAADTSFVMYPGLTAAAGHLLEVFADPDLRDLVVPKMYGGEWGGTMCLTESQAGTALDGITTKAVPTEDPREFMITGEKIFISCGDHELTENIIHLVLARVPGDPMNTRGISLFLVPKHKFNEKGEITGFNDVHTTAIEHKMGIHGSCTCSLSFGDNDNCTGYLIGKRCKGLAAMFHMMNEARIACGIQGSAMANYAYQLALAYAKERKQSPDMTRKDLETAEWVNIIEHPDVRRNLMIAKAYSEGTRALLIQTSVFAEKSINHPDAEVREHNKDLLELLTPICKAYSTDKAFKVTELAIQVLGGYGYVKEYGIEQLMRDVKITSIYEGTNGVQALDLLGRKMRLKDGGLFLRWIQDANEFLGQNMQHPRLSALVGEVDKAKNRLFQVGFSFQERGKKDPALSLFGATPYLELFGHVEIARLHLHQALIADGKLQTLLEKSGQELDALISSNEDARFYYNKIKTATFFINQILPDAQAIARQILSEDRSALDIKL